jgi:AraC-like DNA-binding protein
VTMETPAALELVARYSPRDAQDPTTPFPLGHGLATARLARLHYELLAVVRGAVTSLAAEDALSDFADAAVRTAYMSHSIAVPAPASGVVRRHRDLVEATKVLLNQQVDCVPSLRALARHVGCSPFHLSRVFHDREGVTLRHYVGRLRAHLAADALARGTPDLTDLALRLGYTDHSHFTNAFRREWGCPPSRFRERYRRR